MEVIEESLSRCNVLKINDEEIVKVSHLLGLGDLNGVNPTAELLQPVNFEDQVQQLISRYQLQMVVLTCGAFGSYVVTDSEMSFQPTPKVQVADTVGAGDPSPELSAPPSSRANPSPKRIKSASMSRPTSARSRAPCPPIQRSSRSA